MISRTKALLENNGKQSVNSFHKRLGKIMWDKCGMARNKSGLDEAIREIQALRQEFEEDVRVLRLETTLISPWKWRVALLTSLSWVS